MRLGIAGVVLSILVSGCAATYAQRDLMDIVAKLSPKRAVLVSTPANGIYGNIEYRSSGKITSQEVRTAFSKFASSATVISDCKDLQCLSRQQAAGSFSYLVVPQILHWEDRATEWSGIPDRIEVELRVFDGETLLEVGATVLSGKSKWATFGGDHPEDLLPEPLSNYVKTLYE